MFQTSESFLISAFSEPSAASDPLSAPYHAAAAAGRKGGRAKCQTEFQKCQVRKCF